MLPLNIPIFQNHFISKRLHYRQRMHATHSVNDKRKVQRQETLPYLKIRIPLGYKIYGNGNETLYSYIVLH